MKQQAPVPTKRFNDGNTMMVTTRKNGFLFVNLISKDDPTADAQLALLAHYQDVCQPPISAVNVAGEKSRPTHKQNAKCTSSERPKRSVSSSTSPALAPTVSPCRLLSHQSTSPLPTQRHARAPSLPIHPATAKLHSPAHLAPSTRLKRIKRTGEFARDLTSIHQQPAPTAATVSNRFQFSRPVAVMETSNEPHKQPPRHVDPSHMQQIPLFGRGGGDADGGQAQLPLQSASSPARELFNEASSSEEEFDVVTSKDAVVADVQSSSHQVGIAHSIYMSRNSFSRVTSPKSNAEVDATILVVEEASVFSGQQSAGSGAAVKLHEASNVIHGNEEDVTIDCWRHRRMMLQAMLEANPGKVETNNNSTIHNNNTTCISILHNLSAIPTAQQYTPSEKGSSGFALGVSSYNKSDVVAVPSTVSTAPTSRCDLCLCASGESPDECQAIQDSNGSSLHHLFSARDIQVSNRASDHQGRSAISSTSEAHIPSNSVSSKPIVMDDTRIVYIGETSSRQGTSAGERDRSSLTETEMAPGATKIGSLTQVEVQRYENASTDGSTVANDASDPGEISEEEGVLLADDDDSFATQSEAQDNLVDRYRCGIGPRNIQANGSHSQAGTKWISPQPERSEPVTVSVSPAFKPSKQEPSPLTNTAAPPLFPSAGSSIRSQGVSCGKGSTTGGVQIVPPHLEHQRGSCSCRGSLGSLAAACHLSASALPQSRPCSQHGGMGPQHKRCSNASVNFTVPMQGGDSHSMSPSPSCSHPAYTLQTCTYPEHPSCSGNMDNLGLGQQLRRHAEETSSNESSACQSSAHAMENRDASSVQAGGVSTLVFDPLLGCFYNPHSGEFLMP